jgi:PAS domain S-box-containing protein
VFLAASANQEPFRLEYRLRRADGVYRWAIDAASPRLGPNGEFLGYVGSVIDIDKRREVENALRESEERLRLAVDNAEIGFWDVDVVNNVLIWPPRTKAMFGISAGSPVTMQDFYDGLHPDDRTATSTAFAGAADPASRTIYDVEYRTVGKEDGVIRWVAAKGRGVFDGPGSDARCLRVIGTAIEITARKTIEERLRELNETLESQVETRTAERNRVWAMSRDLFAIMGFDGRLKAINPAWETTLCMDTATLLSLPFPEQVHPDDHDAVRRGDGGAPPGRERAPLRGSAPPCRRVMALDLVGAGTGRRRVLRGGPGRDGGEGGGCRARGSPGSAPPVAEDGGNGPADRRCGSRLQQPAHPDHRQPGHAGAPRIGQRARASAD